MRSEDRGLVLVIVAMMMVALVMITALVVDIGYAKQERRQTQNAADSAALAAAQELDGTSGQVDRAIDTAMDYAAANLTGLTTSDWLGCVDPEALPFVPLAQPSAGCVSFDSSSAPTQVRVRVPRTAPTFFGRITGTTELEVTSGAVAARAGSASVATPGSCGLCIINGGRLQIAGIQGIAVAGGAIEADRLTANSSDSLPASAIQPMPLKWFNDNSSNWGRNVQPAPQTFNSRYQRLSSAVVNPFAGVTIAYDPPTISRNASNINWCNGSSNGVLQPNVVYTQNVNLNCGGTLDLAPGTYYFSNTLVVNNGVTLQGSGVTLVFGCANNSKAVPCNGEGGKFNFNQGSTINITAPTTGAFGGFTILFDPNNASGTPNQLSGNITLNGAVYAKRAGFNVGSSSAVVRAWTVVAGGNFDFNQGRIIIDNNAYTTTTSGGSGPGSGAPGSISLVG